MTCAHCGFDYRGASIEPLTNIDRNAWLYGALGSLCEGKWIALNDEHIHPLSFASGLRSLIAALASNGYLQRLRVAIAQAANQKPFRTDFPTGSTFIEDLEIDERVRLFELASWFMQDWPDRFIWAGRRAQISRSYFQMKVGKVAWWLDRVLIDFLNAGYYSPSSDERRSLTLYLRRTGQSIARNNVNAWLGLAHNSKRRPTARRWAGYGSGKLPLDELLGLQT